MAAAGHVTTVLTSYWPSLRVLNISSSNVHSLAGVELVTGLTSLAASSNQLASLEAVLGTVARMGMLHHADLRDNSKLNKWDTCS